MIYIYIYIIPNKLCTFWQWELFFHFFLQFLSGYTDSEYFNVDVQNGCYSQYKVAATAVDIVLLHNTMQSLLSITISSIPRQR